MATSNPLRDDQYGTSRNLTARASVYRYATSEFDWFAWVFDRLLEGGLPDDARIIEIGGGPAALWNHNAARIPKGWQIVHTDFSAGMVDEARALVARAGSAFEVVDAMSIPHGDASFDAVIANHMLYHVPDRAKAIAAFARILAPGGRLFATTTNARSLAEVKDLIPAFNETGRGNIEPWPTLSFSLEDGQAQLEACFRNVELHTVNTVLEVSDPEPLVSFISSRGNVDAETQAALLDFVRAKLRLDGPLRVNVRNGMFTARKA